MHLDHAHLRQAAAEAHAPRSHDDHDHFVQFYEHEESLLALVGDYLGEGLRKGDLLLVIATPEHQNGFCEQLAQSGLAVDRAIAEGRFKLLDARETLSKFMVKGLPDWERFRHTMERVLTGMPNKGAGTIRAYGEMVDLLWRDGNPEAAVQLEEQWNDLRELYSFSLFCAYVMASFYKQPSELRRVCDLHSHVVQARPALLDGPSSTEPEYPTEYLREIAQRKAVERELRTCLRNLRATEEATRQSQTHLRDFVDNANVGLHWVGADGEILWANKAELELLGYEQDEYVGRNISDVHVDQDAIADILARLRRNEDLLDYEARLRSKDGSIKQVCINSTVYRENGEFVHTRCFTRDVTAQKKLERAMVAKARHAERSAKITSAIAEAVSPEQVYEALVDQTAQALGASSAGLWIVEEDDVSVQLVHSVGYADAARAALAKLRLDHPSSIPVLDAIRDQETKLLSSRDELLQRYPHLRAVSTEGRFYSVVCIPLAVQGCARGGLGFTFEQPGNEDDDRGELLDGIARYGAQALERLRLLEREKRSRAEAEKVAHRLGVLNRASRAFAEVGPESSALLQSLVELVCADFADACGVLLRCGVDDQNLEVTAVHHRHPAVSEALHLVAGRVELRLGVGLTGRVAETGEVVLLRKADRERLLELAHPDLRSYVTLLAPGSVALVPMRVRGRVIGVLAAAQAEDRHEFDEADVQLLEELAERAAMAVDNGQLYEANEQARRRAESLHALAGTVNRAATLEDVFEAALSALSSTLGAERSSILTFDADDVMRFKAWHGLSETYRAQVEGHSPWSRDAKDPTPILIADVALDPAMSSYLPVFEQEGIRALGFIPLVAGGKLLGKFMIYFAEPHAFTSNEREIAVAIANHVAAAIMRFCSVAELQRTVRFNEVFTAMLGHDLRNPLSGMTTTAEVLQKRAEATPFAKPLARIVSSGARMSRMIDQLLDFTRVRLGPGIPVCREKSDLHDVLLEVVDELKAVHPNRAIHVYKQGDCRGEWDVDRLAQVFSNLVANAINHGIANVPVEAHLDGSADHVVVEVKNGGTIPKDILPKLFEPMAGGDQRGEKSAGLGLGLYITRQVVLAHAGSIHVSSDAVLGTTLTVTLPRSEVARE
jgi:PAS domain S-box-containing protein